MLLTRAVPQDPSRADKCVKQTPHLTHCWLAYMNIARILVGIDAVWSGRNLCTALLEGLLYERWATWVVPTGAMRKGTEANHSSTAPQLPCHGRSPSLRSYQTKYPKILQLEWPVCTATRAVMPVPKSYYPQAMNCATRVLRRGPNSQFLLSANANKLRPAHATHEEGTPYLSVCTRKRL